MTSKNMILIYFYILGNNNEEIFLNEDTQDLMSSVEKRIVKLYNKNAKTFSRSKKMKENKKSSNCSFYQHSTPTQEKSARYEIESGPLSTLSSIKPLPCKLSTPPLKDFESLLFTEQNAKFLYGLLYSNYNVMNFINSSEYDIQYNLEFIQKFIITINSNKLV
jgi:hypothetical protein